MRAVRQSSARFRQSTISRLVSLGRGAGTSLPVSEKSLNRAWQTNLFEARAYISYNLKFVY